MVRVFCDMCGKELPAKSVVDIRVGKTEKFELCESCAGKLKSYMTSGKDGKVLVLNGGK